MDSRDNPIDDTGKSSVLSAFLDTNIVLEGKPIAELPWAEIQTTGTIRAIIVPRAMDEIDAKKRDGRLAQRARAFNRLITPAILSDAPVILRDADPRVELSMAICDRIPWSDYDELDPDDGDCRIVAECLHARGVDPLNRVLISHDIKPLAYAKGRGLAVHRPSDDWLRSPEPGPQEKELQRLKQQLVELRKTNPSFKIQINVQDAAPLSVLSVGALTPDEASRLADAIRRKNGPQDNSGFGSGISSFGRDSSYDGRYRQYISDTVPAFAKVFSKKMELMFNQRLLSVRVANIGQIRAEHLVIIIEVFGGWMHDKVIIATPSGPPAPTVRSMMDTITPTFRDVIPRRVGRHEFQFTHMPQRGARLKVSCEDFRSADDFQFDGVIVASADEKPLSIQVSLTAANLNEEVTEVLRIGKILSPTPITDLVDLNAPGFVREYSLQSEVVRLVQAQSYSSYEWDRDVDDD